MKGPCYTGTRSAKVQKKETEIGPFRQKERGSIERPRLKVPFWFIPLSLLILSLCLYPLLRWEKQGHSQKLPPLKKSKVQDNPTLQKPTASFSSAPIASQRSPTPPSKKSGGVFGEVRDLFERPVSGVRIQIQLGGKQGKTRITTTDSKGRYQIPLTTMVPLFVFAYHPQYAPLPKPVFLELKAPKRWVQVPKIVLLSGRKLMFRFLDPGGTPLSGVRALLQEKLGADRGPFGDPPKEAISDPKGIVQFFGLPPNSQDSSFQLRIIPPAPWIRFLLLRWPHPPEGNPVSITLQRGASLQGRVEDAFGRPSKKAELRALPLDSRPLPPPSKAQIQLEGRRPPSPSTPQKQSSIPYSVRSDDQGRFLFSGLPKGPSQIIAHPSGPQPRVWTSQRIHIPRSKDLILRLPKGACLEVRFPPLLPYSSFAFLRSATGRSWVRASPWNKLPHSSPFQRDSLPREKLRIQLKNPQGFDFTSNILDFESVERLRLDLSPLQGASLRAWLKMKKPGNPKTPVLIRLISPDPKILSLGTIAENSSTIKLQKDGHFEIGPIPAGIYEILWASRILGQIHLKPGERVEKTFSPF